MTGLMQVEDKQVSTVRPIFRRIPFWTSPAAEKRPVVLSFLLAVLIHAAVFAAGSAFFVKPAGYGVAETQGGMEIAMVAALPEASSNDEQIPEVTVPEEKSEVEMPIAEPPPVPEQKPVENELKNARASEDDEHKGDGSSPVPGQSSTTFFSAGEASADGRPGYLKNPPPPYPREAVLKGQEGLVLLSVVVDKYGHAENVELKQSSGFFLLDKSALKAVKKWKFNPGKMGFLASESKLVVPIRFRIEDGLLSQKRG